MSAGNYANQFIEKMRNIAKRMSTLNEETEIVCTAAVTALIESKSKDIKEIEYLLDSR